MLALSHFHTDRFKEAADLLEDDPGREGDASLQYTYGISLVRSDRAAEAERTFSQLLLRHGDDAPLLVVLGQAHVQQGDYEAAVASLTRALALEPAVPDANATLGIIHLKQGRLPEAAAALRAELAVRPDDVKSRHHLAVVLELQRRPEEAAEHLRAVLKEKPEHPNARYLMGKVLLAQGAAADAAAHLEEAVRLDPQDAATHYQLGQAYQKLGKMDLAETEFEAFRKLKDVVRGSTP
jgi:Flp pilus assembly protein TadD